MARISTFNVGMYSFNAQVVELQSQSSRNRKVEWYLNGSYIGANTIGTGTTVSPTRTFSNLSAGTYYSITTKLYWSDTGSYITSLSASVTTNRPPDTTPPTVGSVSTNIPADGYTTLTKFNVSVSAYDNSGGVGLDYADLYIDNQYNRTVSSLNTTGSTQKEIVFWDIPILKTPKSYRFHVKVYDKNGNVTTSQPKDQLIYYDNVAPVVGNVSVSQVASGLQALGYATDNLGLDVIIYQVSKANQNVFVNTSSARVEKKSGERHIFQSDADGKDFVAGSVYYIKYTAKDKVGNFSTPKETFLTYQNSKPSGFSWTTDERDALDKNGAVTRITWQRWNILVDEVKAVASWFHNTNDDIYNVLSAKMSSSDKTMTATRFNTVKNAIGSMNSTGISDRVKGDFVLGSYFVTLSQKVNTVEKSTSIGTSEQLYNMELLHEEGLVMNEWK